MVLTNYALEQIGFKKLPNGFRVQAAFYGLHIYQASGFKLADTEDIVFEWCLDGQNLKIAIGNNVNAMCNLLGGDVSYEDLAKWEQTKKCQGPYLAILLGPTKEYLASDCHFRRVDGGLNTYDSFKLARKDLEKLAVELLPSILIALKYEYSRLPTSVDFELVESFVFGETSEGERLHDMRATLTANLTSTYSVQSSEVREIVGKSAELAARLDSEAAKLLSLGLRETDNLKAFLFCFLAIEIFTNKTYKNIDRVSKIEVLINSEARVVDAASSLLKNHTDNLKYLHDKFVWCVIKVWNGLSDEDVKLFASLKSVRNGLAHGQKVAPDQRDVRCIRDLAMRILQH